MLDVSTLKSHVFYRFIDGSRLCFCSSTGPSLLVPETTRKTSTAVASPTAAITAERPSKSPASLCGTSGYTQVNRRMCPGQHRKGCWGLGANAVGFPGLKLTEVAQAQQLAGSLLCKSPQRKPLNSIPARESAAVHLSPVDRLLSRRDVCW